MDRWCSFRFNPRPRAGRNDSFPLSVRACWSFNPRPRAGREMSDPHAEEDPDGEVSNHAHVRGGMPRGPTLRQHSHGFQSTPTCGAESTNEYSGGRREKVSIHAHVRGGIRPEPGELHPTAGFNPRPRAGRNGPDRDRHPARRGVSIHAHVRGGMYSTAVMRSGSARFQSTPTCGAEYERSTPDPSVSTCFNPRPRAGRNPIAARGKHPRTQSFNPRPRAGRNLG